jgi:penicillin-binding protein 2
MPIPGLSPGTLQRVRAGLRMVVADDHGTGKRVRHDRIAIAGKTGTAEVGGGKPDHAWFAGYAPADNPRVAFVVVLEHGGSGGHVAGPVAHDFVQALLDTGVLHPDRPRPD